MYPNPYGNQQQQQGQGIGFQPPQQNPPYPQQTPGYPPAYPQGQAPGYPPAYPQGSAPYPPATGFPPNPGYPAPQYPPSPFGQQQQSAYPTGNSAYPPQGSAYPNQPAPGYPSYPQQGYPPQQAAYPGAGGYPTAEYGQPQGQQGYAQAAPFTYTSATTTGHSAPGQAAHLHAPAPVMQYQEIPTVREGPIDANADAQALRKAMKGFGTDEKAIINILGKRTSNQRQQIAQAFKAAFGKDLIKDLKSELGGRLEDVVVSLMKPRFDYMAEMVFKAMSGLGTKEKILVDILCTATNSDMHNINAAYMRLYKRPLEKDLQGDTSGAFRRLLVSMSTAGRSEDSVANPTQAADDAQKLLQAGEKKWGTDESMFNMILATRSYAQLRLLFHEYERLTGHAFEKAIEREFSGDVESAMLAVVKSAKNRAGYFAERLHESIAGFGTKDEDLIFIVVSRADVDLENVKQEYQKMYGKSLANDIAGDTGGDYKKILLALCGM